MTEESIYSKRWRLWDAIMLYARGVMYVVFTVLVIVDYLYVNRLASEGVSFSYPFLTPTKYAIAFAMLANTPVLFCSVGVQYAAFQILRQRRAQQLRWSYPANQVLIAAALATAVHLFVFRAFLNYDLRAAGLFLCITNISCLLILELARGIILSAEALTRDQNPPAKPAQEPSPD